MNVLVAVLLLVLVPVTQQEPPLVLTGGRVLVSAASEPEDATVLVRGGRIEAVGADLERPWDARLVDVTGLVLLPAFVDGSHHLPLDFGRTAEHQGRPVDDGRDVLAAMVEGNRRGLHPERLAWRALGADASAGATHHASGFAALLVSPEGAWFAGTSALVALNGRPPREAVLAAEVGQTASLTHRAGPDDYQGTRYPATLMGILAHVRQMLLDAVHHEELVARHAAGRSSVRPPVDAGLAALAGVLSGSRPLVVFAQAEEDIRLALGLGEQFPALRLVIAGGREAHELADALRARGVGVIHDGDIPEKPERDESTASAGEGPWRDDVPPRLHAERVRLWTERASGPARLVAAGVPLAFGTFGRTPSELLAGVRRCVEKGGLSRADALAALCEGARRVLGDAAPEGRLASGAWAGLAAWKGDPLDEEAKVALLVSDGVLFDLRDTLSDDDAQEEADDDDADDADADATDTDEAVADADATEAGEAAQLVDSQDAPAVDETPAPAAPVASAEDAPGDDDAAAARSRYRSALHAALADASPDATIPVEIEEDRQPSFRTGGDVLVRGATLLTVADAGVLTDTDLLVRDGRIAAIGPDLAAPEGVHVVDASGRFVIPGIIDCHAHIAIRGGINEWTRNITPEVTIEDEVDPDDVDIYRALAGGVTSARLLHGSANAIGGRHEVIKLRWGRSAPELVFEGAPRGVKFALGENPRQANWGGGTGTRFPKTRMGVELSLRRAFEEARRYADALRSHADARRNGGDPDPLRRDLRLEALAGILSGDIAVHSHCYRADEVLMLIRIAEEFGFTVQTFQHVLEAYKVAREIGAHGGAGCSTFIDWWGFKVEALDGIPYNPALVHEAGVPMSINSDSSDHIRRLYLEAAKAVRYGGVPTDDALAMVTRVPAEQLGIDERVGTLEVGKDADFAVFSRHPFDTSTVCELTFIDGEVYFERRADRYGPWAAEVARRIDAGRSAASGVDERPALDAEEARRRALPEDALSAVTLPRDATRAPSTPPRPHGAPVALLGGTVHTMDAGRRVQDGAVLVRDGRIVEVRPGPLDASALEAEGYSVIDTSGLHVWPGLVDGGSGIGLGEISAVNQSMDVNERGGDQPDVRASTAYHPASELVAVARVAGITSVVVEPGGSGLQGQSALFALEGWTASEALVRDGIALHLSAPRVSRDPDARDQVDDHAHGCAHACAAGGPATPADLDAGGAPTSAAGGSVPDLTAGKPSDAKDLSRKVDDAWKSLRTTFADAREYLRQSAEARTRGVPGPRYDPRLEALAPYVTGRAPLAVAADGAAQIADALDFADAVDVDIIITGGRNAWKVADRLALADVPVLVGPVNALPSSADDPYDAPFANAGILHRAGVRIGFRSGSSHGARDLPFDAAQAVAFGLDADAAMFALTAGTADILGVSGEVGRIAPGLRADLFVTDGHPLQITSAVRRVLIGGRDVGLESKHTRLYEEYRGRLLDPSRPSY